MIVDRCCRSDDQAFRLRGAFETSCPLYCWTCSGGRRVDRIAHFAVNVSLWNRFAECSIVCSAAVATSRRWIKWRGLWRASSLASHCVSSWKHWFRVVLCNSASIGKYPQNVGAVMRSECSRLTRLLIKWSFSTPYDLVIKFSLMVASCELKSNFHFSVWMSVSAWERIHCHPSCINWVLGFVLFWFTVILSLTSSYIF